MSGGDDARRAGSRADDGTAGGRDHHRAAGAHDDHDHNGNGSSKRGRTDDHSAGNWDCRVEHTAGHGVRRESRKLSIRVLAVQPRMLPGTGRRQRNDAIIGCSVSYRVMKGARSGHPLFKLA